MTAAGNVSIPFAYKGEAQLVRWGDGPKGRTVTLLLDPHVGAEHPFKAMKCGENGSRMQIAAVLVGDDDQPAVPPTKPAGLAKQVDAADSSAGGRSSIAGSSPAARTYTRSQRAAIMCQSPDFQAWIKLRYYRAWKDIPLNDDKPHATATTVLKSALGIQSRTELDTNPEAAARFDALRTDYELRDMVR